MRNKLISSLAGAAFILAGSGSAFAADLARKMPVKAPPPPPPAPVYSWTGWYVGGNVGGGWGHRDVSFTANDVVAADLVLPPQSFSTDGVVGGLQLGYNWQFQPNWLLGFETDFDWSSMRGASTAPFTDIFTNPFTLTVDEHIKWFGTVRGRLGWLPLNNLLIYGTGGFAYGRVEHTGSISGPSLSNSVNPGPSYACGLVFGPPAINPCFVGSSGNTATGWTAGGGVEYALWQQWSIKLEYLYVSLAGKGLTETAVHVANPGVPGLNTLASLNANFSDTNFNVVRVGLNYQFH